MPFKSAKQREFLRRNHPKIYERWKKKYGTKIDKGFFSHMQGGQKSNIVKTPLRGI